MKTIRVQGWDPVMLICQIVSMQTLHYLTLALLIPPLLATFTSPDTLAYSGGPTTVSHLMDWREMSSKPTVSTTLEGGWNSLRGAWSGGKQIGTVENDEIQEDGMEILDFGLDDTRGWMIGIAWMIACCIDIIPLYYLIRRPTYILDFSLTLNFVHLILTTYYAKSFPASIFYWAVQALGALVMIVIAEQLCIKREMSTDLSMDYEHLESGEVIELNDR
ncbi:hypothetical protein M231_06859 [Tremella mesenterica]|uniref:Protein SYS1 n=1 Tax=Tremella mesenterica TaxID=5217 RepID=A0A4Q1BEV5_TREME|nr:hypothetical protein M231_06859 [Tremella mesenterica]